MYCRVFSVGLGRFSGLLIRVLLVGLGFGLCGLCICVVRIGKLLFVYWFGMFASHFCTVGYFSSFL